MATTYRGGSHRRGGPGRGRPGRGGHDRRPHVAPQQERPAEPVGPRSVELPAALTVKELADRMSLTPVDIIKALMKNGIMATINQELDYETAAIVASDLGWEVTEAPSIIDEPVVEEVEQEDEANLVERPP